MTQAPATVDELRTRAEQISADLDTVTTTLQRLEAAEHIDALGYPDDHTITTMTWEDETNADGTFDIDLNDVYDNKGYEVASIGGTEGAVPAGRYGDEGQTYTVYDVWREDPDSMYSDIRIARVRAWLNDYRNGTQATR